MGSISNIINFIPQVMVKYYPQIDKSLVAYYHSINRFSFGNEQHYKKMLINSMLHYYFCHYKKLFCKEEALLNAFTADEKGVITLSVDDENIESFNLFSQQHNRSGKQEAEYILTLLLLVFKQHQVDGISTGKNGLKLFKSNKTFNL